MIGVVLGVLPLVGMFTGILILRWPAHKAGLLSVALAMAISFLYCGTSINLLISGWLYGILIIHKYTLAYLGSFILSFYMMSHGCFDVIGKALKRMTGGVVFKVFFLCFGIAILMLSAGAGIDWIAIVLHQFGVGTWAIPILIDGSCDAFSQFAYLSTPITIPTLVYGRTFSFTEADLAPLIGRFLWVVIPAFTLGMLWVLHRDGVKISKKQVISAVIYGEALAAVANVLLLTINIMGVGVLIGVFAVALLFTVNMLGTRLGLLKSKSESMQENKMTRSEKILLLRAISPILIVSVIASAVALPWFSSILEQYVVNIPLIADQVIPVQIFQPAFWVFLSILLSFLILKPSKDKLRQTGGLLRKRFVPFVIASWICSGLVFTYNWSAMAINNENKLVLPPEHLEYNLIYALAMAASKAGQLVYVSLVPFLAIFGCMLFGHELTSTLFFVRFHFISAESLGITKPLTLIAGHMVSNLGIVDVRKMMRSLAIIGAYGEEWKTMRFTFVLGLLITLAIIPLLFFAL